MTDKQAKEFFGFLYDYSKAISPFWNRRKFVREMYKPNPPFGYFDTAKLMYALMRYREDRDEPLSVAQLIEWGAKRLKEAPHVSEGKMSVVITDLGVF